MSVWRKQTVRYTVNGRRCTKDTAGAKAKTEQSSRFYGTLRRSDGTTKQVPPSEDRKASETLLRHLQTDEDRAKALGLTPADRQRQRPLSAFLTEYERHLQAKENTERYVSLTLTRIRSIVDAVKAKTLADLTPSAVAAVLASWRRPKHKPKPISVGTWNHYARAVKGFSRWLWIEGRTPDDPLRSLRLLNARADVRHRRRALTPGELSRLVRATAESGKRLRGLRASDHSMLYLTAAYTGLRASELASLSVSSFDLEAGTLTLQAARSKRRRTDTLPLHPSLAERLRPWLATKTGTLWHGTWNAHRCANAVKMIRSDLKRAGIAYRDADGRVAHLHALRHTFITSLARSGVHPAKAKELARHSTITLTLDVYSHVSTDELRDALGSLPAFG